MPKPELNTEYVRSRFDYNKCTGELVWRSRPANLFKTTKASATWNKRFPGTVAGRVYKSTNEKLYSQVGISGYRYATHRLVMLWHGFDVAGMQVDHIDGNGKNNRIENLRLVDQMENSKNAKLNKLNSSGVSGVRYRKDHRRWSSVIVANRKTYHLGNFKCLLEAACARKSAELKHGFHENHGRSISQ